MKKMRKDTNSPKIFKPKCRSLVKKSMVKKTSAKKHMILTKKSVPKFKRPSMSTKFVRTTTATRWSSSIKRFKKFRTTFKRSSRLERWVKHRNLWTKKKGLLNAQWGTLRDSQRTSTVM